MATNFVSDGKTIDWTNDSGSAVDSGDVVVIGNAGDALLGIALVDIATSAVGAVQIEGVFEVTKASAAAITVGEHVQWDSSASNFDDNAMTPAAGDVTEGCTAMESRAATTLTVKVKLTPGTGVLN